MPWPASAFLSLLLVAPLCMPLPASAAVQADGRVAFRHHAPGAARVVLDLEGAPPQAMVRDERGVWRITTAPLPPDVYAYSFIVDGVPQEDPDAPDAKPILTGGHESLVEVTSAKPQPWDFADGPHGALHRHRLMSALFGEPREVWVYTPPDYDPSRIYPVLILLHGVMEDARAWTTAGRADLILDGLIARKQAVPMIAVFPLGYGFPDPPKNVSRLFLGVREQRDIMDAFGRCLFEEILPFVASHYRTEDGAASRAIAGASMGGAQALYLGLNHPDRFGRIGAFSGAFTLLGNRPDAFLPPPGKASLPSTWLACGKEDPLLGATRACAAAMAVRHVPLATVETPGAHTWSVWRHDLLAFAPTLFRHGTDKP